ncbi:HK-domain-containing protein [Punctularia strigosozonata HHB-11173 SS5]|uniref:HK-domain-containing protein n=1 Tax=Punctularia strigosozonata (strain HHB-11173) TaxID=741275 RepID=UPI0004416E47|nr:HK-domain-containing protein [Punctularia strigosozonata HHB-11173 SS5]EIN11870.1 HK-domain-containing protein [Punctularia strigosozonata HHB-11173 SS5]
MGAAGVHLGQSDMPVAVARRLLQQGSIIGVSCNNVEQVRKAVQDGADYIGIGAVWGTQTKKLTNPIIGVRGVGEMLRELDGTTVKAVAIGGIKTTNVLRTLHGSISTTGHALDGVAVVSELVASPDPAGVAQTLATSIKGFKSEPLHTFSNAHIHRSLAVGSAYTQDSIIASASALIGAVRSLKPLVHQITNNVVTTQSANATIALGASPIMATAPEEMKDLARVPGALLVNFGTIANKDGMLVAGHYANLKRKPIVFDPVGVGATEFRRRIANELLNTWQSTVIKGNAAELGALANSSEVTSKGVDSNGEFADAASVIKQLALTERCIVVLTGAVDFITDGRTVVRLANGHPLLGDITGSGCMTGTSIATFCGAACMAAAFQGDYISSTRLAHGDMLIAAVAGVLAICIAAEIAAVRPDVHGPGTFLPALIDELAHLTPDVIAARAKVEISDDFEQNTMSE